MDDDRAWLESRYQHIDVPDWPDAPVYDSGGEGDVLVFAPVLSPFDVIHVPNIRYFGERFRVVTYRRRESLTRPIYPNERAREIRNLLHALDIDRVHFCGLNEGAIAAFALARIDPQTIRSIICTCIGVDNLVSPFKHWLGRHFPGNASPRLVGRLIALLMLLRAPDSFVVAYLWSKNTIPMAMLRNGVLPLYEHYSPPIEHLTMPVLNIQSSPVVSNTSARRFVEALPNGELKTIRGLSHLCMWTKPDEFNGLVEEFLSTLS